MLSSFKIIIKYSQGARTRNVSNIATQSLNKLHYIEHSILEILLLYQIQIFNAAHKLVSMLIYLPVLVKILIV